MDFKSITHKELKELRLKQFKDQDGICPILKQPIDYNAAVFDHRHKTKKEVLGEDGKGLLRGVIHRGANVVEGKAQNAYKRYGLSSLIDFSTFLRNLADYLDNPPFKDKVVHPSEREFITIKKSEYNALRKKYFKMNPNKTKFPSYPRKGKITKTIQKIKELLNN